MKITYKKQPRPTGLQAVGAPLPNTTIKMDGAVIGNIIAPSWNTPNHWSIMIAIKKDTPNEDNNPNCDWRWFTFKRNFDTEPEARTHFTAVVEGFAKRYTIHRFTE